MPTDDLSNALVIVLFDGQTGGVTTDLQTWRNPDCGLKTRRWEEVRPALQNLVAAAKQARAEFSNTLSTK